MGDPNRIQLWITPPGQPLDLAAEIQRRAEGMKEQEWQAALQGLQSPTLTDEGKPGEGAKPGDTGAVRQGLDTVLKTMTGVGLDELERAVQQGTLGDKVSMRLATPIANISEALVRDAGQRSGLTPDVIDRMVQAARNPSGTVGEEFGQRMAEAQGLSPDDAAMVGKITGLIGGIIGTPSATAALSKAMTPERLAAIDTILKSQRGSIGYPNLQPKGTGPVGTAMQPGKANINVERIGAEKSVKKTITRLNQLMAQKLAGSRAPVTHEQTIAAGQARGLSIEDVLAIPDEHLLLEEARATQQAIRDMHNKVATIVDDLKKRALKGDAGAANDLMQIAPIAMKIGAKDELSGTGGGRLLEARKIISEADRARVTFEDLQQVGERMAADGVDGFMLARWLDGFQTARERKSALSKLWDGYKTVNDALRWMWLQWLLSGPVTHAANVVGNTAVQMTHIPESYIAEWINRAFFHDAAGVQRGETWVQMHAAGQGATTGWRWMGRAIKGEDVLGPSKVETRFDVSAAQFGWDPNTPLGRLADLGGTVAPTRMMTTADAFYKGYTYTTMMPALALREAMARSKDPEEIDRIYHQLLKKPTSEMMSMATDAAKLRTLNAEFGPVGSAIISGIRAVPGGWLVAPFLSTPGNSYKWFHQRAPLLSVISVQNWSDIAAGGAARDMALSRMLLGNTLGLAVAYQVYQGNITGGLPVGSNKNLKRDYQAVGGQTYSVRVGDDFYYYKRTDPVGTYLGAIATAVEIYTQLSADDPVDWEWENFAIAAALAGSRVALDTPWLSGVSNVLDAIAHPDVDGKKMAQGFAKSLVPAGMRQLTRSGLPFTLDAYPEMRELNSIVDAIKADVPWLVTGVAPLLHPITGETIERPPGWLIDGLSPIFISHRRDDPVLLEIIRNKMNFSPPRKVIGIEENLWNTDPTQGQPNGVRLSPGQYFTLITMATTEIRDGQGRTLHQAMTDEVLRSDAYKRASDGPDQGKELRLKAIYQNYYRQAQEKLLAEDTTLAEKVNAIREQRIRQTLDTDSPEYRPGRIPAGLPPSLNNLLQQMGR